MREDSLQILYRLDPNPRKAYSKMDELKHYIDELESRMMVSCRELDGWQMKSCTYHDHGNYTDLDDWHSVTVGERWGGDEVTGLFRSSVVMPKPMEDAQVFLNLSFGGEALLSINGKAHQGIDFDRKLANLDRYFKAGERLELYVEASVRNAPYDSFRDDIRVHHVLEFTQLVQIDKTIEDLYYYCWVLYDVSKATPDKEYAAFLTNNLEQALRCIDYRAQELPVFKEGVVNAIAYIKEHIYASRSFKKNGKVSIIGQSHLDLVYLWQYKEFLRKNPRTAMNMVRNLDEFPDFRFSQSQARMYSELQLQYPDAYAAVKEKIAQGSWEPVGAFYVEPDCNLTGGEAMVRQIGWGKRFYRDEFGVDPQVCWVPDVFGCYWTMPQLLKKSGVHYMSTIKLAIWNDTNRFPYSQFWWEGPDGSRVLTYFPSTHFVSSVEPAKICEAWDENKQKEITGESFFQFGLADGGGGATRDMVARMEHIRGLPGMPEMSFDTIGNFFARLATKSEKLPVWQDELYLETHRGTFTTKAQIKKENRQLEFLLHEAELMGVVAKSIDGVSRQHKLNTAWERLLVNQFHDILPGSHVTLAAADAMKLYREAREVISDTLTDCLTIITGHLGGEDSVVVFNALSWHRDDEVVYPVACGKQYNRVVDCVSGHTLPCTMTVTDDDRPAVRFIANGVPALGYKLFRLLEGTPNDTAIIQDYRVSTAQFTVTWNDEGDISSIYDNRYNRELVENGVANRFQIFEDRPGKYSAWDIIPSYKDYEYRDACRLESLEVVEQNDLRTVVRVSKRILDSSIVQDIIIHNRLHRIDFDTNIQWQECEKLLKVAFPVAVHARNATYDIPFGTIERATHDSTSWDSAKFEVCAHKWADLSENDFGVALLNDCKYGYDIRGNVMRLTLLKAPIYPDPVSDRRDHRFLYSIYPHQGNWQQGGVMQAGYELNMPMRAVEAAGGIAPTQQGSWFASSSSNFIIETVKEADDGKGLVLRGYDAYGQRGMVQLQCNLPAAAAQLTNLLEEPIQEVTLENGGVTLEYKPYEIATVKLI